MFSQVSELQKLGVDTHVVCDQIRNLDQFKVKNIHCLIAENPIKYLWDRGMRKLRIRQHYEYLVEVLDKIGANIVHSHFGNIGWSNLGAIRKNDVKHVVTFYGYDVNRLPVQVPVWRNRYIQLFEEADLFLCEGTHMARCIVELGCPEGKVKVQHLGVDIEKFSFQSRRWIPGESLKVLIASSFREKKGIPYAIAALGMLHKEIPIELTIIGDAGGDEHSLIEKAKILKALDSANLMDNTRLLGYQPHAIMMKEAYSHHVFLHPSVTASDGDTEGGAPVAITEMMATGMPVISTTHCDIPEVVGESLQFLLAPERDSEALFEVIRGLLEGFETWTKITASARARVVEEYCGKTQAIRLLSHYGSILRGAGDGTGQVCL